MGVLPQLCERDFGGKTPAHAGGPSSAKTPQGWQWHQEAGGAPTALHQHRQVALDGTVVALGGSLVALDGITASDSGKEKV